MSWERRRQIASSRAFSAAVRSAEGMWPMLAVMVMG